MSNVEPTTAECEHRWWRWWPLPRGSSLVGHDVVCSQCGAERDASDFIADVERLERELAAEREQIDSLRSGVKWLASLGHTYHHTHPIASPLGWQYCDLVQCEKARIILKGDAELRATTDGIEEAQR